MLTVTCRHRRATSVTSALAVCAVALTIIGLPASAANAASQTGYVRLAHLSPDTPKVDVYLDSLSSEQKEQRFPGVGYGTVSGYLSLPAGAYAVSMRASGSPPSSPPVLTTHVTVLAKHAYTVAGVGRYADLGLKVINDDLTSPMDGKASVRVIQASIKAPLLNVSIGGGSKVATQVQFATTTPYRVVKAGTMTMRVQPSAGGAITSMHVTLQPDGVYTVLVLDGKSKLVPKLLVDAGRDGPVPKGPVDTGAGGSLTQPTYVIAALTVAAVALTMAVFLGVYSRRRSAAWSAQQSASRLQ